MDIMKYAKQFKDREYIESGYIAVRKDDGILITATGADLANLSEESLVFVNDKNIETFEGNFRAAAVILFCAIRQSKVIEAAAIVDSDSILKLSSKRRALKPILDDLVQLCGVSVKCATKNVAAEVVTALAGQRNACFMPDAGALVRARSIEELLAVTAVLDKASYAELAAEDKGGTQSMNAVMAFIECMFYKLKSAKSFKKNEASPAKENNGAEQTAENAQANEEHSTEQTVEQANEGVEQQGENTQSVEEETASTCLEENVPAEEETASTCLEDACNNEECKKCCICDSLEKFNLSENGTAVLTRSYYASAVSATGKPFVVPEKYVDVLGQQIPCVPSVMTCTNGAVSKVEDAIGEAPACIIAQHGVVVRGKDMDEVKNICNILEEACKEYLN